MAGGINSFKDKIMFEIYKANDYSNEYRVVYFSELDDHNRDKEIDRAMKGDHYFDGFIFTLKKERAMKQLQDIVCLLYTSPSPRDKRQSRMPSSA